MKYYVWLLMVVLSALAGCASAPAINPNIDISGDYTFSKGKGVATVTQVGNDVKMFWTFKPRNAPEPHYEINVKRNGLNLSGTYICLVKGLRGCGTVYKINFKIDPSGNRIVATEGEDPTRHGITNGFTLYRSKKI